MAMVLLRNGGFKEKGLGGGGEEEEEMNVEEFIFSSFMKYV